MGRFFRQTQSVKLAAFAFGAAFIQAALAGAAFATNCSLTISDMSLGTLTSINSNASASIRFNVQCSGYPNTVTRGNALPWCVSVFPADNTDTWWAQTYQKRPLWLNGVKGTPGARALNFNLFMADYTDCPNCVWGGGPYANYGTGYPGWANPSKGNSKVSDVSGGTITAVSDGGQNLAAGYYTGAFKIRLNWDDSQGKGGDRTPGGKVLPSLLCARGDNPTGGSHTQTYWTSMNMNAAVRQACNLQVTGGIAFQPNISLNKVPPTQGGVQVSCNAGALSYQVGISKGNYADAYGTRSMRCENSSACGATQIQYLLFRDAGYTQLWDDNFGGPNVLSGSCPAGGNCVRNIPVYAKVVPRPDVPAGPYRDQVTVTLQPVAN